MPRFVFPLRSLLIVLLLGASWPALAQSADETVPMEGIEAVDDKPAEVAEPAAADLGIDEGALEGEVSPRLLTIGLEAELPDWSASGYVAEALGVTPSAEVTADLSAWPRLTEAADLVIPADTVLSPLDALDMSLWERTWWGRGGVMRRVGLFPTHPDAPLDDLRQIAHVRRRMLRWHQTLGLATVASMGATVIGGQIAANGGSKGFHEATLPVTIGLYSTTAALALLSPPKPIELDRGGGLDSITIHRWLAVAHVAGMLITPLLGEDAGRAHYAMGYATFATFSAAMLTVTLLRR